VERYICSQDAPWTPEKGKRARHPDAQEVHGSQIDGWPSGDIVTYRCPWCGQEFECELPQ